LPTNFTALLEIKLLIIGEIEHEGIPVFIHIWLVVKELGYTPYNTSRTFLSLSSQA